MKSLLKRGARREFTTETGKVNAYLGGLVLALVTACYVPSWLDDVVQEICVIFRCARAAPEASPPPWWLFVLIFVYAIVCVAFIGSLEGRAKRSRR